MEKKNKSLTPLRDIISSLLSGQGLQFDFNDAKIWEVWEEVVGPGISKNAKPAWIKNKVLTVAVRDPIWLQELNFMAVEIRDRLNSRLRREAVKTINFRMERQ